MKQNLISVVIPVFHNSKSLPDLLAALAALARRNARHRFEFLLVDDGSKDDSFAVLSGLFETEPRMRVFRLSRNFGSNCAIRAGLDNARGDATVVMSADLQDSPEVVDEMIHAWEKGEKVVIAARAERDDPFLTRVFSEVFYRLFRRYAISEMPLHGFDFFLVSAKVRELLSAMEERNAYLMGLTLWVGFNPKVVTYRRQERPEKYGRSMWTISKKIKYFIDSFVGFSYLPIRAASFLGFAIGSLGALYAVRVVYVRLTTQADPSGYASLMVAMLVLSGLQMLILGVFGEYLWRNLDESRRRPRYIIDENLEHPESSRVRAEA